MDRGAWQAAVLGIAENQKQLRRLSILSLQMKKLRHRQGGFLAQEQVAEVGFEPRAA